MNIVMKCYFTYLSHLICCLLHSEMICQKINFLTFYQHTCTYESHFTPILHFLTLNIVIYLNLIEIRFKSHISHICSAVILRFCWYSYYHNITSQWGIIWGFKNRKYDGWHWFTRLKTRKMFLGRGAHMMFHRMYCILWMGRAGVGGESESDNDKMKSWSQQFINLESHLIHPFICLIYFIIGLNSFEM